MRPLAYARLAVLATLCFVAFTPPALAYVDPTAAGAALQSAYVLGLSLFMGLTLAPRRFAAYCARLLRRRRPGATDVESR